MPQMGSLYASMTLESQSFIVGLKKAADQTMASTTAIQKRLDGLSTGLKGTAALLGGSAILAAASRMLDYASSLGEVAQQLGVTTKDLQEYRYIATQTGISQETMDKSLAKLSVTMGQARKGVAGPKAAFAEFSKILGVDILKSSANAGDALALIAGAVAKIKDPTRIASALIPLMGRAAQQLVPALKLGTQGLNSLRDAAQSLGLVLSDDRIARADETADKLSEVKQVLEANITGAVADNARAIFDLANALTVAATASLKFAHDYPIATAAVGGALVGGRIGGPWGAVAGGLGGAYLGNKERALSEDSNMDLRFRASKLRQTAKEYGDAPSEYWRGVMKEALDKEIKLSKQATAAAAAKQQKASPPPVGGAGAGAGSGGGSSKAASDARRAADEAARKAKEQQRNLERVWDDSLRLAQEQFGLEAQLTPSLTERAHYELRRLDLDKEAYEEQLKRRVRDGELTQRQANELRRGNAFNDGLQRDIVQQKLDDDLAKEALDLRKGEIDLEREGLQHALDGARTQDERRRLQLELLDLAYQQKRLDAEAVIVSRTATDAQKKLAQETLDKLGGFQSAERAGIERDTMGPIAAYLDKMPKSAAELNEAYQQVAADGLSSLNDGLADAIVNSQSLGDVFHNVANQILADLIKIALQKTITGALGNAIGGLLGGSSLGGLLGQGNGITSANAVALPGLATGGFFDVTGGAGGVDRNVLSLNGIPAARVNYGERVTVTPANDLGPSGGTTIHQSLTFSGAVDLATRGEVYRVADAARQAAIQGVHEAQRRRG